jgi:hypothetical protein
MPITQQFEPRHDWQKLKALYLAHIQTGGKAATFSLLNDVPIGTLNQKTRVWRKEWRNEGTGLHGIKVKTVEASKVGKGGLLLRTPSSEAGDILQAALPDAARALVHQLTDADGNPSRDPQATRAALQLLKDLQHNDDKTASPYASMTDGELEARATELWPSLTAARIVLGHTTKAVPALDLSSVDTTFV